MMSVAPARLGPRKCKRGHKLTPENLSKEGRCRECGRINNRTSRRRMKLLRALKHKEDRDIAAGKIDYLFLTPEQQEASDTLRLAIREAGKEGKLACQTPEVVYDPLRDRFIDHFPHADYDERTPPTVIQAARLCAGCPVIRECFAYALTITPAGGVFGGVSFVDGKPQTH